MNGCFPISTFESLVGIPRKTASSVVKLKISAVTAEIKKYTSIIKKKRKKHHAIVFLAKSKVNTIEV